MIILTEFCSRLSMFKWLQNHLLLCPFKYLTSFDCPGCGFQRSVMALLQGHLNDSLKYYPATIPLILYLIFSLFGSNNRYTIKYPLFKKYAFMVLVAIIAGNYIFKMALLAISR
jgi:hypothetical protein